MRTTAQWRAVGFTEMQPTRSFSGRDYPVEQFLKQADQYVAAHRWRDGGIVIYLSHLLECDAKRAFTREVSRREAAEPLRATVHTLLFAQQVAVTHAQDHLIQLLKDQAMAEAAWSEGEKDLQHWPTKEAATSTPREKK